MGKVFDRIDEKLSEFLMAQHVFFVATAPSATDGHVNLSPKGLDSFRILDETTVLYADLAGSGVETIAHLRDNGRITLMFCAFEGSPKIVRLHGRGEVIERSHASFDSLSGPFEHLTGIRSLIRITCTRISDSCGYGVPIYEFQEHRRQLPAWSQKKTEDQLVDYVRQKNKASIDNLPAMGNDE